MACADVVGAAALVAGTIAIVLNTAGFFSAASNTVAQVRSYSRSAGSTSQDSETARPGQRFCTIARARRSWAGLRKENRKQVATAVTPASARAPAAAATAASSSGVTTVPSGPMRSGMPMRCAGGTTLPGVCGGKIRS